MQVSLFNDWRKSVVQSRKIEMLKANGRYTVVGVDREDVFSDKSLGEWEQVLENEDFVRIHKSYIVNLRYVEKIGNNVVLKDGTSVPLARRRKKEFEAKYKEYLMREDRPFMT
ncbi:MAG: LytTR family transcriptional regulator [Lachnospiraceae bacterium]|nr:LytTR family transcriptional regulator [Lachnospiraceae bacterium]